MTVIQNERIKDLVQNSKVADLLFEDFFVLGPDLERIHELDRAGEKSACVKPKILYLQSKMEKYESE